jgi:hypothetical protein
MPHAPRTRLLVALFDLAQASETTDLYMLAEEAGLNLYRTLSEVHSLSLAGFVDARRLRLTAQGFAVAVALSARLRSSDASSVRRQAALSPEPSKPAQISRAARRKPKGALDAGRKQSQGSVRDLFERDLVA